MALAIAAAAAVAAPGSLSATGAPATGKAAYSPRVNYALHCQGCHLPDGSGMPGRVPDMRGVLGRMIAVPEGRDFIARVPGSANAKLTDAQMADLLNWLVAEMGPVSDFRSYTAAEVGRLRADRLQQVVPARAALMRKLAQAEEDDR